MTEEIKVPEAKPLSYKQAIENQDSYLDDPRLLKIEIELSAIFEVGEKAQRKYGIGKKLLAARKLIPSDKLFGKWVQDKFGNTEIGATDTRTNLIKLARLDSWEMIKHVGGLTKAYKLTSEQCDQLNARWDEETKSFNQPIDDVLGSAAKPTMKEISTKSATDVLSEFGFDVTDIEQDPKLEKVGVTLADMQMQILNLTKQIEQLQKSPSKGKAQAQTKAKKREEGQPLTKEEKAANTAKTNSWIDQAKEKINLGERVLGLTYPYTLDDAQDAFYKKYNSDEIESHRDNYKGAYRAIQDNYKIAYQIPSSN